MVKPFDPDAFIRRVGERLVREFTDAKAATTPSTIGTAAEQPVRNQLAQLLPRSITVGEGFVIDSYGGTSRQQDVVLYERDICPHPADHLLSLRRRHRRRRNQEFTGRYFA